MYHFTLQPSIPDREALRAQCAAAVNYTPAVDAMTQSAIDKKYAECFNLLDAPDDPAYGMMDGSDAGDTAIGEGDKVCVFVQGMWRAKVATVVSVRADGQYLVRFDGATRWIWAHEATLLIKASALAVESEAMGS